MPRGLLASRVGQGEGIDTSGLLDGILFLGLVGESLVDRVKGGGGREFGWKQVDQFGVLNNQMRQDDNVRFLTDMMNIVFFFGVLFSKNKGGERENLCSSKNWRRTDNVSISKPDETWRS